MKKVFKASILAASVAFAFAANAASISSTPAQLSKEGLAVDLVHEAQVTFDVVVTKDHAATSVITLTFPDTVDFETNALAGGACVLPVVNGQFTCGDVSFDVGAGNFTFDDVAFDYDDNTITFKVNIGNALSANSAFRINIGDGAGVDPILTGASNVAYSSVFGATAIETGSGTIAEEVQQFAVSVATDGELNGVIERAVRKTWVSGSETADTDTLTLDFVDAAADVSNPAFADGTVITLKGDFSDAVTHAAARWTSAEGATVARVDATTITFTYTEAQFASAAAAGEDVITFTNPANANVMEATTFTASVAHDFNSLTAGAGVAGDEVLATNADAGEWTLDAAVINVPYLPINYGLSSNIEVANHGSTDAEIMAEGFDQNGKVYDAVVVKTVAGETMGKISENDLKTAFGIGADEKVKLNVTFVIDQDADKVTLVPYYKEGESRINVMSDQYKADDIR
ncbi:hypothetical protein [Rheinheimera sp.]|uniref:hypothetical protein n=1 Tax=Rheinheimera sp. TaxID=1869214 RepID=UPI0027B9AF49|nr:hypothetical protein [Rheinheimera sp.]